MKLIKLFFCNILNNKSKYNKILSYEYFEGDNLKEWLKITKKYGQGTLNPETGVFTPNKS